MRVACGEACGGHVRGHVRVSCGDIMGGVMCGGLVEYHVGYHVRVSCGDVMWYFMCCSFSYQVRFLSGLFEAVCWWESVEFRGL